MTFTMKTKESGTWQQVDLTPMVGITMECLLLNYSDHPSAVAEFILDDGTKAYMCSTSEWVDFFQGRGDRASLIEPGVKALSISHPDFLNTTLTPLCEIAKEVFGAGVTEISDGLTPEPPTPVIANRVQAKGRPGRSHGSSQDKARMRVGR